MPWPTRLKHWRAKLAHRPPLQSSLVPGIVEYPAPETTNYEATLSPDSQQQGPGIKDFDSVVEIVSQFVYAPLDPDTDEIRLLRIKYGSQEEELQCEVFHASMGSADFKALSYTCKY
jgi:hypothetical protein